MAIEVISGRSHGEVVLIDRKEDGTVLLLVCDEWEPGQEPIGPTVLPELPPETEPQPTKSEPKRRRFPMGLAPAGRTGTLTLDVTALSPGLHAFVSERFCETAVGLLHEGLEDYVLQPEDEGRFGLRATFNDEVSADS